ncbi:hypothetical protein RND71_008103 [Anisodus tanguticus]|uniref:Uncharacterized protein n=1 Tax=Anisodus tanguticus TaxID=243964 RepID=A0AAE1SL39_9SOLA|nr:hypothetical protein RND71_008103 [Anisodus tanguticus]
MDEVSQLLFLLEPVTLDVNKLDSRIWTATKDVRFSVNSCYILLQKQAGQWDMTWPCKMLWKT